MAIHLKINLANLINKTNFMKNQNLKRPAFQPVIFSGKIKLLAAGLLAAANGGFRCAGIGDAADSPLADYRLRTFGDLMNVGSYRQTVIRSV